MYIRDPLIGGGGGGARLSTSNECGSISDQLFTHECYLILNGGLTETKKQVRRSAAAADARSGKRLPKDNLTRGLF